MKIIKLKELEHEVMLPISCDHWFKLWCARIEHEPGIWLVRHIPADIIGLNREARAAFGRTRDTMPWSAASLHVLNHDLRLVEDAQSRSIKTGQIVECEFWARASAPAHRVFRLRNVYIPDRCPICPTRCGVLLIGAAILAESV